MPRFEAAPEIYIKKYLHTGEDEIFFSRTDYDPTVQINDDKLSFAICYDIEIDEHACTAKKKNSTTYVAGIFYALKGIDLCLKRLQAISVQYEMDVIMSNYAGKCWDCVAGGRSAIWSKNGEIVIGSNSNGECLLIAEKYNENWRRTQIRKLT